MRFKKISKDSVDISTPKELERTLETITTNISENLDTISSEPTINGNRLLNVALEINKDNLIAHKLGREYVDFSVYKTDTGVNVWLSNSDNSMKDKFIVLQASNDCLISLWVI